MIDHIVIGAASLYLTARIEQQFGAAFGGGGKHPMMATHNRLLKLQDDVYCEVIAVDPYATTGRPRWFSLDTPQTKIKLRAGPRPLCWAWSVSDIQIQRYQPQARTMECMLSSILPNSKSQ